MNTPWSQDAIDAAVSRSLRETGLPRAFHVLVRGYLLATRDAGRICCGADCDPCVIELSRAVDRAREILEAA